MATIHNIDFVTSVDHLKNLLPPGPAEVAFVGRSNAGKSSAINAMANRRRLAYVSKTPGRTQDWKKAYVSLAPGQTIDYESRKG